MSKKTIAGIVALSVLVGLFVGITLTKNNVSNNAVNTTNVSASVNQNTQTSLANQSNTNQSNQTGGGTNGFSEEQLTGDAAEKVKAAILAAVPGGTILRMETDAQGAAYEAHVAKSDGSQITVKLDSSYNVVGTE
ncbi:MAG: hypothetical protein HY779_05255 [Rubrobacteridae bacterium]|nr:hypothetical protein [Rubrobacteridae bacterium]